MPESQHLILVISDGTGHTAENVTQAALMQFPNVQPAIDVSGKAVEETAREVLNLVDLGETRGRALD